MGLISQTLSYPKIDCEGAQINFLINPIQEYWLFVYIASINLPHTNGTVCSKLSKHCSEV